MLKLSQTWKVLGTAFRQSLAIQNVSIALVGLLLTVTVWQCLGAMLLPPAVNDIAEENPATQRASIHHQRLGSIIHQGQTAYQDPASAVSPMIPTGIENVVNLSVDRPISPADVYWRFAKPVQQVFVVGQTWFTFFYYLLGSATTVLIWSYCGLPIVRGTIVRVAHEKSPSMTELISFSKPKGFVVASAISLPVIAMMLIAIPAIPVGWLMRLDVGVPIAGFLWILVLLVSSLIGILAFGLMLAWPLMWGAIAADDCDAFDAISRTYAYASQRPLHFLCYVSVAMLLGYLGWFVVWGFTEMVIGLGYWTVEIGCGGDRLKEVAGVTQQSHVTGVNAIRFACSVFRGVASSYSFSFFFSLAAAIYLLLRRDTDETELDQIFEVDT